MPVPSTTVSFTNIQTELGGINPISLSEYYNISGKFGFGIIGIPTSGLISLNNFRGKSKPANVSISITGTNNTINTASDNANYRYAIFPNNGTFSIIGNLLCDILVVGGGGSGGGYSGGGGGGDVILKSNFNLNSGVYTINIGNGGIAPRSGSDNYINGNPGETSSITSSISGFIPIYAAGGGGGIGYNKSTPTITPTAGSVINGNYSSGGGGGAGSDYQNFSSGSGNSVSGNGGSSSLSYSSGGGGGAVGNGFNCSASGGGNGGSGFTSSITGTNLGYGGGGGGSTWVALNIGTGVDGGGNGSSAGSLAQNGIDNRGGGGGGSGTGYQGGNGGKGIIIIRYSINNVSTQISGINNIINTPIDNINYRYAFFSTSGTFTINRNLICDILIVGGGGGGSRNDGNEGGAGGGGGGVGIGTIIFKKDITYTISIGSPGNGAINSSASGNDGNNTTIIGDVINEIAYGGGAGGLYGGNNGGSGGGGSGYQWQNGGGSAIRGLSLSGINTIISYYGNNGGIGPWGGYPGGGGGGGAGGIGANGGSSAGGAGGNGIQSSIIGSSTYYGGGGGGASGTNGGGGGSGGLGGGGTGGNNNNPSSGNNNTGGGGGGTKYTTGGAGGSGVLIIRYLLNDNVNLTSLRRYPSKAWTSISSESDTSINGKSCRLIDINLNTTNITYGSGTYKLYYTTSTNDYNHNPFSFFNFDDDINSAGGHTESNYNSSTGAYQGSNYLVESSYLGSWFVIKTPMTILLSNYYIIYRNGLYGRTPKNIRLYGSNDGNNWTILDDVQNMTYNSSYIFNKIITNNNFYNYYGVVINSIQGGQDNICNFVEFVINGQETI